MDRSTSEGGKKITIRDIMPSHAPKAMPANIEPASARETPEEARKAPVSSVMEFLARRPRPAFGRSIALRFRMPAIPRGISWKSALLAAGFLAAAGFSVHAFSKAVVVVTPRSFRLPVDMTFSAGGSSPVKTEAIAVEENVSMRGASSGREDRSERATGRIVIYNAHSTETQQLVRRTRFETADGKVYRLTAAVTVPGATVADGKIEPSTIEADVAADQPGDNFNIGIADFTIPGFKGTAKYERFYAKSKTPMAGGFLGRTAVVRAEDVEGAKKALEQGLKEKLAASLRGRLPEGSVIPDDAIAYVIAVASVEPAVGAPSDSFEVRLDGTASAMALAQSDIEAQIFARYGDAPDGALAAPAIRNFDALTIRANAMSAKKGTLEVAVQGDAQFVWNVPSDTLRQKLAAAASSAGRNAIFASYPEIQRAAISYRPSWWRIFPRSEENIVIEEALE